MKNLLSLSSLTIITIRSLTTAEVAVTNNYLFEFLDSLTKAHVLNIYNYNITSVFALYKFMNSVILILLIVVIKNKIYEMGFVHAKRSVYLDDEDAKTVYVQRKRYQTLIFFAILMAVIVQ